MVTSFSIKSVFAALTVAALLLVSSVMFATSAHAQVTPATGICEGIDFASANDGGGCGTEGEGDTAVQNIIGTIVDILSIIVGAVSVIFIIVGGLRYITSSGDSGNVQAARNTILYAVVGLIIVIFAQIIVRFVIDRATRAPA